MANENSFVENLGQRFQTNTAPGSRRSQRPLSQLLAELRRLAAEIEAGVQGLANQPVRVQVRTAAVTNRHLVYVHGICRHDPGYSDEWWNALHPFTDAFGAGDRDDTRQEVLWSDLVGETNMAAVATRPTATAAQTEWAWRVRGVLEERSAALALQSGPSVLIPELTGDIMNRNIGARNLAATASLTIPGLGCVEDFAVYMFNDTVRAQIIGRFTDVVRPLLESGAEIDIISHSWGTVVAYEGLRELEDAGLTQPNIHDFFTVGAALSIFAVKQRLRPANRDGRRPALVQRWINLNATGDPVGGQLQGRPYQVDIEFLHLANLGCGLLDISCAHGSYFKEGNVAVNRDIFAHYIDLS